MIGAGEFKHIIAGGITIFTDNCDNYQCAMAENTARSVQDDRFQCKLVISGKETTFCVYQRTQSQMEER